MKINTVASRSSLPPRREPYWDRVAAGQHLGYRCLSTGAGTWIAKIRNPDTGERTIKALGDFGDLPASDRYDAAAKAARAWFEHVRHGGSTRIVTVADACRHYLKSLRDKGRTSTADDAEARFNRWVFSDEKLANTSLLKLTKGAISSWVTKLTNTKAIPQDKTKAATRPRSASTINRDMTTFRAALNLALEDGHVTTAQAWESKLKPIEGADNRRDIYLDRQQRQALIAAAAPDIGLFVRALCALPLRPGAMASLTAADFDKRLNTLTIRSDKAGKGRTIKLPATTAALFTAAAKDKLPGACLFTRADGAQWVKDKWTCPTRDAVTAAGLPAKATLYTLRHSLITDLVTAGTDLATVASISGTSILMIQRNYHHLQQEVAAAALERVAL
ncbi:tyrosine-type recombinase/integrase [Ottowia sp. VDI28]|uniref:tyrosine-type recombinase/integrase n=1 Tax=Ottowia sp. VDI28 TaxID=3133968 RepID=UPI003C2E829E